MEYGTFIGTSWSLCFLSYVYGITSNNALLLLICFAFLGLSTLLPFLLAFRLNKKYPDGDGMTYIQGLLFAFSMFMWACLLDGMIVYGYFEFLDNGAFLDTVLGMLEDKQIVQTYTQIGLADSYKDIMKMMNELTQTSSFEKAMAFFNNNFILSVVLCFPVAVVASLKVKIIKK